MPVVALASTLPVESDPTRALLDALTCAGHCELEAAVMVGTDLSNGAVCGLTRVKNPILLAEHVRTQTPHTFIGFEAAEKMAEEAGHELKDPDWFLSEKRRRQQAIALERGTRDRDHDIETSQQVGGIVILSHRLLRGVLSQAIPSALWCVTWMGISLEPYRLAA